MKLGWVDYLDKNKKIALDILDELYEQGTLDELGIASVRDGFSEIFFPGITTVQTMAKYFLIVPYAVSDVLKELNNTKKPMDLLIEKEFECCKTLKKAYDKEKNNSVNNYKTSEIIGINKFDDPSWIKRAPSDIYWNGIRKYEIIKTDMSLKAYLNYYSSLFKKSDFNISKKETDENDDPLKDSIDIEIVFLKDENWINNINRHLSSKEKIYLKTKITNSNQPINNKMSDIKVKDSILAELLNIDDLEINDKISFKDIKKISNGLLNEKNMYYYDLACIFDDLVFILNIVYANVVNNFKNSFDFEKEIKEYDYQRIIKNENKFKEIFTIFNNPSLESFIFKAIENIKIMAFDKSIKEVGTNSKSYKELENTVKERADGLKDKRSKIYNTNKNEMLFNSSLYHLDYRFNNARVIIEDILEKEDYNA